MTLTEFRDKWLNQLAHNMIDRYPWLSSCHVIYLSTNFHGVISYLMMWCDDAGWRPYYYSLLLLFVYHFIIIRNYIIMILIAFTYRRLEILIRRICCCLQNKITRKFVVCVFNNVSVTLYDSSQFEWTFKISYEYYSCIMWLMKYAVYISSTNHPFNQYPYKINRMQLSLQTRIITVLCRNITVITNFKLNKYR